MAIQRNIGLFNECFPPVMDGVSVCVQNYAHWLQQLAGDVSVVTPKNYGVHYDDAYEVLEYISVPVPFRKPYMTGIGQLDPVFLKKLLDREFRIVHTHTPFMSGRLARQVASVQHIPMVATFHSKYRDDFKRVLQADIAVDQVVKMIAEFYERADEVWVPQESVKEVLYSYGYKGNVEVVDNGSDLCADRSEAYFAEAREALGVAPDDFVMLFVGQHIWEKNPRFIIEALEMLPDVRFRMFFVGGGYAAEDMKRLVAEKGLDSKVSFVGVLTDREAITRYYAAADLFLFPSLYDNAPLVVREAAALHTPAVMMEGATASTILTDGVNGFLTPNDTAAFAALLRQLVADPERVHRVGVQASHSIVRSWEDVCGEVLDRYNALISRKKLISRRR